jgi:hypothetical protein
MQIAGAIGRGKIRSLVLRAPFDQFHLFIALDEPVHDRKQEAHGESAHISTPVMRSIGPARRHALGRRRSP